MAEESDRGRQRPDVSRSWGILAPSVFDRWTANLWKHVNSVVAPALLPFEANRNQGCVIRRGKACEHDLPPESPP